MKNVIGIAAVLALTLSPGMATTSKPPAPPTVQAQIDDLKQQVAALQQQVHHLKSAHTQQDCISLWCA